MTRREMAEQNLQDRLRDVEEAEKIYHKLGGSALFLDWKRAEFLVTKAQKRIANLRK